MAICITSDSGDVGGKVGELFGRCKSFIFIDMETEEVAIVPNTAACLGHAGLRAASDVLVHKPSAVITGGIGKNASRALRRAGIEVLTAKNMAASEALDLYRSGKLKKAR